MKSVLKTYQYGFGIGVLLLMMLATDALADGGTVQISQVSGPFRVTVYTTSAVIHAGPEDVSVLVQDRTTNQPILDAAVQLSVRRVEQKPATEGEAWVPPCCKMKSEAGKMDASHAQATNKLLYATTATFSAAGRWEIRADVQAPAGQMPTSIASVVGQIQVEPPAPPIVAYWPFFLLPVVSIAGYVLHSNLRKKNTRSPRNFIA